ncbi:hypothetical protein, partial [Aeromonas sp. JL9]|uniref:hypothetical protein n=1 Tax=Aeromonas sp. JL9 TaxID=2950549 RepID=UPI00210D124F
MGMLGTTLERSKIDVTINQQSAQQAREIHRHETGETLDRNESEIVTRQARSGPVPKLGALGWIACFST